LTSRTLLNVKVKILLAPVGLDSRNVICQMAPLYYCPWKRLGLPVGSS